MAKAKPLTELNPNAPTGQNARCIAQIRLDEMYNWAADVDNPYEVQGLHNLRIAAKRLRYTFEIFEDVLPFTCQAIANELTQIQDELGALHDSDVVIVLLKPSLVANVLDPDVAPSAEQRYGLEQLLRRQLQLREEHYQAFRQHWYQLLARDFRREILDVLSE